MQKLARTIRLDDSDANIFARPAESGEWAIPGGFEFSNWSEADLAGKARQSFANGWLSLDSFGRATLVAVTAIEAAELEAVTRRLAEHFVTIYGAPDVDTALPVAREELAFMQELCADHDPNVLLLVQRELTGTGVKESFRAITPAEAEIELVAIHGGPDTPDGSV
ncbi:hypothetical protein Ga0609869_000548 [Rhodovulum iodosum]|uniref:Uncharacterized protein n=1 Tax=Rhodovulum iodosum TaxID=68291 RepID=A0ABV3XQX0_9RHOB|nr:DUF6505 family protein [Rhodovulum robiginosum]RSK31508.1 hypothetical protein EJA01_15355 [Rhodovulum robiginosum]